MLIGVPKEAASHETRVAATPDTVQKIIKLGYDVVIEHDAGYGASLQDPDYEEAGARIGTAADVWNADIVMKVNAPTDDELNQAKDGLILASLISPGLKPDLVDKLSKRDITVLAMDAVPRISRAQSLDVLSSMANIAGYRAVVEAAHEFGRFFTGQVTAAGKVPPAKVLVVGAGVAGLAAIGAAGSLGAIVRATDPRPEVAEQVKSMGADFLEVEAEQMVSTDGYAKETSEDYNRKAEEMYLEQCKDVDIIITTALIPGKPAPRIITQDMVDLMKPGSVIVDMAASQGGNVAGSVADEKIVTDKQVTIIGYTDLAGRLPTQASQLYGTNLVNLLKLATPEKDGQFVLDFDDVIIRGMTVCHRGESMWPPPPVQVSAAPAQPAGGAAAPPKEQQPKQPMSFQKKVALIGIVGVLFLLLGAAAPPAFLISLTVFTLAVVIGYYVIGNVHHALHTPLMSVTNAISGIIVVGALLQVGKDVPGNAEMIINVVAFLAILVASINVFGGFLVTRRMLTMFRKG